MKNRLFAAILALFMLFFCSCDVAENVDNESLNSDSSAALSDTDSSEVSETSDVEKSEVTPLFWKATDEDGNVLWLFGSIHAGYDYYYPLPKTVMDAYEGSDALAVEVDIIAFEKNLSEAYKAMQPLMYLDGTKISDHIPQELYDRAVKDLKEVGLYMSAFDMYKPSAWSSFFADDYIKKAEMDTDKGIDRFFLKDAKKAKKEIVEIESAALQYGMLGNFSEELQIIMLEQELDAYESGSSVEELKKLATAWAKGDEEELNKLVLLPVGEELDELSMEYWNAMMTERNKGMVDYCIDAIESGDEVFVVVGLAHFLGEDGIVNSLREAGYTVEEID